jgi:hypothetical protein
MVRHTHDLRDGCMNEPAGGETAQERAQNTPKQVSEHNGTELSPNYNKWGTQVVSSVVQQQEPIGEALCPSHLQGGEKNAPAPAPVAVPTRGAKIDDAGEGRAQEGLASPSGKGSQGVGGLEGHASKMGGS